MTEYEILEKMHTDDERRRKDLGLPKPTFESEMARVRKNFENLLKEQARNERHPDNR